MSPILQKGPGFFKQKRKKLKLQISKFGFKTFGYWVGLFGVFSEDSSGKLKMFFNFKRLFTGLDRLLFTHGIPSKFELDRIIDLLMSNRIYCCV